MVFKSFNKILMEKYDKNLSQNKIKIQTFKIIKIEIQTFYFFFKEYCKYSLSQKIQQNITQ
jgi:hypothetical protein